MISIQAHSEPIYGLDLTVIRCPKRELNVALGRVIRKFGIEVAEDVATPEDYIGGFAMFSPETKHAIVWINTGQPRKERAKAALHEALHVTLQMLRHVGLESSDESDEAFTYYNTWVTGCLLDGRKA